MEMTISEQMAKQNCVISFQGILFDHKKNEVLVHATTWMNLENVLRSQFQNPNYCMNTFI